MESLTARFHKEVFLPYLELLKAQYRIHPAFVHAKQIWEAKLTEQELVNGPYLEKAQIYAPGEPLESLPLHTSSVETIRTFRPRLWKHQTDALKLLLTGSNAVIATGTSSGKTLCYQIPILDDLIRNPSEGLRAVIIYPLNALVNDQLAEWERILRGHPQITFARFTGQTPDSQPEYVSRLRDSFRRQLADENFTRQQLDQEVERRVQQQIKADPPNRLNHREAIRATPPNILITNFSMLEYLLERPVDAPIFENTRLKFLVLDEAHAYRGVQATEIAFLIRRLKDRLALEKLTCVATSATLGKKGDPDSKRKVRQFAGDLFHEPFGDDNPIYGEAMEPILAKPSFRPTPEQYIHVAEVLRNNPATDVRALLGVTFPTEHLADLILHDENLNRLRATLTTATRLDKAAATLWPDDPKAEDGLQALLQLVGFAKKNAAHEDLFPTRLHYFVRAQDGLHVCLHKQCPDRREGQPAFFVSRKTDPDVPEGDCPVCCRTNRTSKLVEVVTCRKCGYLFGALQDLGPRQAQNPDIGEEERLKSDFDSFSTELGWASDSYWSYFSVEEELPYPSQPKLDEEEEDQTDLFLNPAHLNWCVLCGKRNDKGAGDTCRCSQPHLREIKVFHRQCPHSGKPKDRDNLTNPEKRSLTSCPNCGARNSSGLEPLRRFQESDDETGIAIAIPLAHFQVIPRNEQARLPRKLLCFTDNRQRAAAFPSLLEEETFSHDMGRHIFNIVSGEGRPVDFVKLAEQLAEIADPASDKFDPDFFLPVSRLPDEELDAKGKRDLWVAETFAYFGIPDSARESAEDLGLVAVEYHLKDNERAAFHRALGIADLSPSDADEALQTLAAFMRHRKAFTLPKGRVEPHALAFGRITADIGFQRKRGSRNTEGWLPHENKDGSYRHNYITDYLRRLFGLTPEQTLSLAERIWDYLTDRFLAVLHEDKGIWKLDHERLFVRKPAWRYVCSRCGIVTPYSARQVCPRKECEGQLERRQFDPTEANIVARWVAGTHTPRFTTLKSEEHTAQLNKDLAKIIEEDFRAAGVNLLSSTTTFEMGINIGDLQKILLRNAPPTSANYVQRVGRSGRGLDKNAVCVTLCRRTKYDADAWLNPPRLMSGEVRSPTVFTKNRVIARRHFNAAVFAQFLRAKIKDERVLGKVQQSIRLAGFLPLDSRKDIPPQWLELPSSEIFLDFQEWLRSQSEGNVFQTVTGRSILTAIEGFENGRMVALESYQTILDAIADELRFLRTERERVLDKIRNEGGHLSEMADIERAMKTLLGSDVISVLAKRGFLPRYAFPLDLVTLETGWSRWSRDEDVELSRDRGLAIAEFAPGAQVIAHKKVFTSAGLYIVSDKDRRAPLRFSKCRGCEQIRTGATDDQLGGECMVCHQTITRQNIKLFVMPEAFSVRIDKGKGTTRLRRATLVRQRQSLTHFIDYVEPDSLHDFGLFRVTLKNNGKLFRYNLGPGNKGFTLCPKCGCSEPLSGFKPGKGHDKLRVISGSNKCENNSLWGNSNKPLAFGHEFETFSLIARPVVAVKSIESLAFALQKGLCHQLELESADIGVSWRWVAKRSDGAGAEVILYDRTPGGAGFVKEGFANWQTVVKKTYEICSECDCEKACYECLRDYSNQSYHDKLDRGSVTEFLGR